MRKIFIGILLSATASVASAAIIVTPENIGTQLTTVPGTITETFNALALGPLGVYVSSIGTYSANAQVVAADDYGGTSQTQYVSVGAQSGTLTYTLTFSSAQSYFGLYWAAIDPGNRLEFYNGATLVEAFGNAGTAIVLGAGYFGNPNNAADPNEQFAYLNFQSNNVLTNFTSVRFVNADIGTGFETDSHSILRSAVPEPSSIGLMLVGLGSLGAFARRRRNKFATKE